MKRYAQVFRHGGVFLAGIVVGGLVLNTLVDSKLAGISRQMRAVPVTSTSALPSGAGSTFYQPTVEFNQASGKALAGSVLITARSKGNQGYFGLEEFFSRDSRSTGSGVIISADGYIVTNYHVVDGASDLTVSLSDNAEYEGTIVATDPNTDLAVVKIDATDLTPIAFANSDGVQIGQWVLAVGNPFNLTSTVTAGIISARARNIGILRGRIAQNGTDYAIESFLQTDAAVNPGNSGGALVNLDGQLIGINTAIATESNSFQGYSFAIPANLVRKVAGDLIRYGQVQRGFIGVSIRDLDAQTVRQYKLSTRRGALVMELTPGGAAREAGLQTGDVITHVGPHTVQGASELQEQVANYSPGDKVEVTYRRGTEQRKTKVHLRNREGSTNLLATPETAQRPDGDTPTSETMEEGIRQQLMDALGAGFVAPRPQELERRGLDYGVQVVQIKPAGPVANAGIPEDFILTQVDGRPITTVAQFYHVVLSARAALELTGTTKGKEAASYTLKME